MHLTQNLDDLVIGYISNEILFNMQRGRRVRIDAMDYEQSLALGKRLRDLIASEYLPVDGDPISIFVLRKTTSGNDLEVDLPRAIGLRNRASRLILLVPDSEISDAESLGKGAFDSVSMVEIYETILRESIARCSQRDSSGEISRNIQRNLPENLSVRRKAEYFVELADGSDGVKNAGANLWMVRLIPDLGSDFSSRLASNKKAILAISGSSKPLSAPSDRLLATGITEGAVHEKVLGLLEPHPKKIEDWLRKFDNDITFDKWPMAAETELELDNVFVLPFINEDGKVDSRCKLRHEEFSGRLFAENKVSAYWATEPVNVGAVGQWLVELCPPAGLSEEYPVLRTMHVNATKRMVTLTLDLSEEERENLAPRYVVRVTAMDAGNRPLFLVSKDDFSESPLSVASAESQEFEIIGDDLPAEASSNNKMYSSLAEGVLSRVSEGRDQVHQSAPEWDAAKQTFTLSVGPIDRIQVQVNNVIIEAQRVACLEPTSVVWRTGVSVTGNPIRFADFLEVPLMLPEDLIEKRKKFLTLVGASPQRSTIETVVWTKELVKALESYCLVYREHLSGLRGNELRDLLLMDSISLTANTMTGPANGAVLLPIHPIRAYWVMQHDQLLQSWTQSLLAVPRLKRSTQVDMKLVSKILPTNMPFVILGGPNINNLGLYSYGDELTHGSALYLEANSNDVRNDFSALGRAISFQQRGSNLSNLANLVAERLGRYAATRPMLPGLRIVAINPGDGSLLATAVEMLVKGTKDATFKQRFEFDCFGDLSSFANPLERLVSLQEEIESTPGRAANNYLVPTISIRTNSLENLDDRQVDGNIALIQGVANVEIVATTPSKSATVALNGLLTRTTSQKELTDGGYTYQTSPALDSLNVKVKAANVLNHEVFLDAISQFMWGESAPIGVSLNVDPTVVNRLRLLHQGTDWVVTVDRNLGLALYEETVGEALGGAYVLDYAPDFIDGLGDRITVTTTKERELLQVISRAMGHLGLVNDGVTASKLLRSLAAVSGRLALRLLGEDSKALEALGLSATMTYLELTSDLKNTVIIPVDAHMDMFGMRARTQSESGQRCDVLLVRLKGEGHSVEFVEVKARANQIEAALIANMSSQVTETSKVMGTLLFSEDKPRIDADLQWARWAGLLRFYAERSKLHGYIDDANFEAISSSIDRIELNKEKPSVAMTGYVVSLNAKEGDLPAMHNGMKVTLLNSEKLAGVGFTTRVMADNPMAFDEPSDANATFGSNTTTGSTAQDQTITNQEATSTDLPGSSSVNEIPVQEVSPHAPEASFTPKLVEILLGYEVNK